MRFFATCPKGIESLLEQELLALGALSLKQRVAGVAFEGELELAYRACLWSRLANRILMPLSLRPVSTADELYQAVQEERWLDHLRPEGTLTVDFTGSTPAINNTHFGSLKVKDAIVDQIRAETGLRPSVDKQQPDLRINIRLHREEAQISLDLSGESLHRRGYRLKGGLAPLKENLAAAILYRCGWPEIAAQGGDLVDPMCGSGTLLIEAGLMAADIAPGLIRRRFGFERWTQHNAALWRGLREEALERRERRAQLPLPEIHGYDANPSVIGAAKDNAKRAGLEGNIRISQRELSQLKALTHNAGGRKGLLVTNPPYGERLSDQPTIIYLYRHLGQVLHAEFQGWNAGVFTGNPELGKAIGLRSHKQYKLYNGLIESRLLLIDLTPDNNLKTIGSSPQPRNSPKGSSPDEASAQAATPDQDSPAPMFANRLRKNSKQLGKWVKKGEIECYRVYDADMPEYSMAIDRYRDWVHVQEYAAPATIDPVKAQDRLDAAMAVIPGVLGVPADQVVLKQRRRQQGDSQYQRQDDQGDYLEVGEGGCRFLVNLKDYLDTGLFLDHRPVRERIQQMAKGKTFLNLFCYTGAATVHAGVGGARRTTSVDMSQTYLNWGRKNLALNGLSEKLHAFIQADCIKWIAQCQDRFDLIFMDPPTFSNSKRMRDTLDIQRDHVDLIRKATALLAPGGTLIFSNNLRRFTMDREALSELDIEEITAQTIDKDFARRPKIHNCWLIRCS